MATKGNVGGIDCGDPWENLANAIIAQAAHDYVESFSKQNEKRTGSNRIDRNEVLRFFHSGWYEYLTDIDSSYLITGLDEVV